MQTSRRSTLKAGLVAGATMGTPAAVLAPQSSAAANPLARDPFTLGVASGDPLPDGFVLWTRLAVDPLAENGLGGMRPRPVQVLWQVAADPRFRRIVKRGSVAARPEAAHAVHVEVEGLASGRPYWYRFRVGRHVSPVGRALTTPRPEETPAALAMAFASCSQFEHGYFTAYRHLAAEEPDLVLHLGDYQYEYQANDYKIPGGNVRDHKGPETETLANYRQRHAQYKTDPDLQAAHAAAPWMVVFDDHEVDNNWADEIPEKPEIPQPNFMDRRAAAFRAYYENMPLRRSALPSGPHMQLFRSLAWGRLANFHMLDTRQYRDDQACGDGYKDCAEAGAEERSLLGSGQEAWLRSGFRASEARWDVLGQQVFFGQRDSTATADKTLSMDSWDGYRASRRRVTQSWIDAGVRNPVVLTGDVHAHWAGDLRADFDDADSSVVGSEFVCSSITSGGDGYDDPAGRHPWFAQNPDLRFWTNLRGYVSTTLTAEAFTARFRCVPQVSSAGAPVFTRATYAIDDRQRGMRQVQSAASGRQKAQSAQAAPAPRSEAEIVADTLAAETGH